MLWTDSGMNKTTRVKWNYLEYVCVISKSIKDYKMQYTKTSDVVIS